MADASAAKRARGHALDATVTTAALPLSGDPRGVFVQADGTRLMGTSEDTVLALSRSGRPAVIAGSESEDGFEDGKGASARFNEPYGLTVDAAGSIVVADCCNHAIRTVSLAGQVDTLAGNAEAGFADGQGAAARFNQPCDVVLGVNGELFVSDTENHAIRAVTAAGAVRTLAGNGEAGFASK